MKLRIPGREPDQLHCNGFDRRQGLDFQRHDLAGPGAVNAIHQALEEFGASAKGMKVEVLSADHLNKPDVGATIARMASLPLDAQPGEKWIYGYSIDVLGVVVEKASGKPLDEFVRTSIASRNENLLLGSLA